jgi:uracil-DNA glycosylase family protein
VSAYAGCGYRPDMSASSAAAFVPEDADLHGLASAADGCRGCDLYQHADQTVFGAGPSAATMMLVGEQPGDREDRSGKPFVGPAGALLDKALLAADIDRDTVYVTNAVKHFKFTERGKRRIHQKPSRTEVVACRPWLFAELDLIEPDVLVLLGATAAQSVLGPSFRLTQHRGTELRFPASDDVDLDPKVVATIHPSAILRGPPEERDRALEALVADLRFAAGLMSGHRGRARKAQTDQHQG